MLTSFHTPNANNKSQILNQDSRERETETLKRHLGKAKRILLSLAVLLQQLIDDNDNTGNL
jgi:hypothetical protein